MFNQKHKEEFLNDILNTSANPERTTNTINAYRSRVFNNVHVIRLEQQYNKDLYNFTEDELFLLLNKIRPLTVTASRTFGRIVTKYIDWANNKGYRTTDNNNPLRVEQSYFNQFVPKNNRIYLHKDDIEAITTTQATKNNQDAVLIQLLFEGVQGFEASEIINLKIDDVDFNNNTITVYNRKESENITIGKRTIQVSDTALMLIEDAWKEEIYIKKNGEVAEAKNTGKIPLPTSDETRYILKTGKVGRWKEYKEEEKLKKYTIYNRLKMFQSLSAIMEVSNNLTTKNIVRSGMIYHAKLILEEEGKLEREQIEKICKQFNVKYQWSMKDYLNREVIEEIYGEVKFKKKPVEVM